MQNLKESVNQEAERRRRFSPGWLRIVVDGAERARWPLLQSRHGRIDISSDDTFIEIYGGTDGEDVRLAAHFLTYGNDDQLRPMKEALALGGGRQVRIAVAPLTRAGEEEDARATVKVTFRETTQMRALLWWWRRQPVVAHLPAPVQAAAAFVLLTLFGAALAYSPIFIARLIHGPSDEVIATDVRRQVGERGDVLTRDERTEAAGLLEAKTVYLEVRGPESDQTRQELVQRLRADNSFAITDSPRAADVALIVTIAPAQPGRVTLTAQLVDEHGSVIWPFAPDTTHRRYEGPPKKVIEAFSRELARDLRALKHQN